MPLSSYIIHIICKNDISIGYICTRTKFLIILCDELEGFIDLQWEVADYFCGSYEEVMDEMSGNATQNLVNVMQMIEMQKELIESYQPHSKGHKLKKRKIIGLGGSRSTGAKGLKRVSDFSRSKSAPAGFGALEEENSEKKKIQFEF